MNTIPWNLFGIRHLSPGGATHLLRYLDKKKPKCVLIEGPADATELLHHLTHRNIRLPIAFMAYTTEHPIHTLLYPLAAYSPEYIGVTWAFKNNAQVRFIDLPSCHSLVLHKEKSNAEVVDPTAETNPATDFYAFENALYDRIATLGGEASFESYWERMFEHNLNLDAYEKTISLHSSSIREMTIQREKEVLPQAFQYNQIREKYMRRQMALAVESGFDPAEIVVVCGAYHVSGLATVEPMTAAEEKALPKKNANLTLMPYSYYRLSSRSGYGAGNKAPKYFQLMHQWMEKEQLAQFPHQYLTMIAKNLRAQGQLASTASVIEGVRLAQALAAMHEGNLPTLEDLHDAAITCLGNGELSILSRAFADTDIGTKIGFVPEGVRQTPLQEDMTTELKRLKLESYKTPVLKELALDLRENRRVKSEEAAFMDLNRSIFFNRLQVLELPFAKPAYNNQNKASWSEKWQLQWNEELEICLVEATLKGETIEIAASYEIKEKIKEAKTIAAAAHLIKCACACSLQPLLLELQFALQEMTVDASDFNGIAQAAYDLSQSIAFGVLRKMNTDLLKPLLQQLYLRGTFALLPSANCDHASAKTLMESMNLFNIVADENSDLVDNDRWIQALHALVARDDQNYTVSGYAFGLLLEKNQIDDERSGIEIARRLSPTNPADLAAAWMEGLASRNKYALLSRIGLWKALDTYVTSLDSMEFLKCVVFLRRAFSGFTAREKEGITQLLGDFWGYGQLDVSDAILTELDEQEEDQLSELNDFDFGDLI